MVKFALDALYTCTRRELRYTQKGQWQVQKWAIAPSKTYESNFIHHDFVQFGKQHIKTNSE